MDIAIIGIGYVGLVTGACFAKMGHKVLLLDEDEDKIKTLKKNICPIYEPYLEELLKDQLLNFSSEISDISKYKIIFITVGTPSKLDGSADISFILDVTKQIKENSGGCIVVNKSTAPIGTCEKIKNILGNNFKVISNPEFLKQGNAINDFIKPDRIIIGSDDDQALSIVVDLYRSFNLDDDKIIKMDLISAELTKYAANAMLATKISFMNEIANISELVGADINKIRIGIGSDPRIGYKFLYSGIGYGGSCLPKDVKALINISKENGYEASLLNSVDFINNNRVNLFIDKIQNFYNGEITGLRFCVWGTTFKPDTDDMRESPSLKIISEIKKLGGYVNVYDPKGSFVVGANNFNNKYLALEGCNALILATEWKEFRNPDFKELNELKDKVIFDGRNQYKKDILSQHKIKYIQVGVN